MIFEDVPIHGSFLTRLERRVDERGFFARTYCADEFTAHGAPMSFVQQSLARSTYAGTLRGMHLQREPHAEDKYVRATRGAIFDAIYDARPESPSFGRSFAVRLSADDGTALFVPAGCLHGYQTLEDETDVLYAMSARYAPDFARCVRFDDADLAIVWPLPVRVISRADAEAPPLSALLAELSR